MLDAGVVRGLVAAQFPRWAGLPVAPVESSGTDNHVYRLGDGLSVRLPRVEYAVAQLDLERRWLPVLAPHLAAEVPDPLALGAPALGYPYAWGVYRWLDGTVPDDPGAIAHDLADFVLALRRIGTAGGPRVQPDGRGASLRGRDVGEAIARLARDYDPARLEAVWERDRAAPEWDGPPVCVHGDLHAANLLARGGRLSAVLDWSFLALGDPAVDLMPAWLAFGPAARAAFPARVDPDPATWRRGRAWAFSFGLGGLAHYRHTNAYFADLGRLAIDQVLAEA
ncbi:aminoglycoside phosphotransferase family protein [Dactylosporangium sp. NPDC000244]|uniref:aminoglycoside phosphotransferase family protein n=1 Tax=Dactylosporangium sp. NPDC000244 TaxID=3154365 RepID=UPI00332F0FE6